MKKIMLSAVLTLLSLNASATSSATFNDPTATTSNGYDKAMHLTTLNGRKFCEGFGFSEMTGGTIACGKDENSYADYDWDTNTWNLTDTSSKNQCYVLFESITCSK